MTASRTSVHRTDVVVPPVAVLGAPTREFSRWANTRRIHHSGVFPVEVCVDSRIGVPQLADAILDGLGKDPDLSAAKRITEPLAHAWLSLGEHTDAIICDAQLLNSDALCWLLDILSGYGVRPWVQLASQTPAADPAVSERLDLLAERGGHAIEEGELRARFGDTEAPATTPSHAGRLPRCDGVLFRAACRDLLPPEVFAEVDAEFCSEVTGLRERIAGIVGPAKSRQLARLLRSYLGDATSTDQMVLRARAAQVAALIYGFQIRVDTTLLIGGAEALPRTGKASVERWWEHLDRYRDPDPGAAAALFSAGIDAEILVELGLDSVRRTDDGVVVSTVRGEVHVSDGARFVLALVTYRRLTGASDDGGQLFTTHRASRIRHKYLSRMLVRAGEEVGARVADAPIRRAHPDADTWLTRYGISVAKLDVTSIGDPVHTKEP